MKRDALRFRGPETPNKNRFPKAPVHGCRMAVSVAVTKTTTRWSQPAVAPQLTRFNATLPNGIAVVKLKVDSVFFCRKAVEMRERISPVTRPKRVKAPTAEMATHAPAPCRTTRSARSSRCVGTGTERRRMWSSRNGTVNRGGPGRLLGAIPSVQAVFRTTDFTTCASTSARGWP